MQDNKLISVNDDLALQDLIGQDTSGDKFNFIIVRDNETGKILQTRKNLVVRSGREFNLRKLFGIPYNSESVTQLNARTINIFGIGEGGTPSAEPFSPIAPTPTDMALNKEVPFRSVATGTVLTGGEELKYQDKRIVGSTDAYYKKLFSAKELILDNENNDYYVKMTLEITDKDARGTYINELALFTSTVTGTVHSAPIIATRVTFQTEPLSVDTKKGLSIDYYVYA